MAKKRWAALLRGVSPMNLKMPELKKAFEAAGFENVVTVLSSGNVVFDASATSAIALEKKCEQAMTDTLGKSFKTIVRSIDDLEALLAADPFAKHRLPPKAKRVITFLRAPSKAKLPSEVDGARIYLVDGTEAFTAYVPSKEGPVFMSLLEKTFGKDITTRTWDTVQKLTKK